MGRSTRQELAPYNPRRGYSRQRQPLPPMRAASKVFTRDVVLIEKNGGAAIPRGTRKSSMHDKGHDRITFAHHQQEQTISQVYSGIIVVLCITNVHVRYGISSLIPSPLSASGKKSV